MENRNKEKFLKRTIQELRRQYSGSLPLMKQERFANTMRSLQEDKVNLEQDVVQTKARREAAEDKLSELELKHSSLEELIATLKDHKGAAKVTEWHTKMNEIRLQDLKLNRTLDRSKEQNKHLENIIKSHERTISNYEEDIVKANQLHEERQLLWEQREVELERTVDKLEKQQQDMLDAATRFEQATGAIPDSNLPVANQLELAVRKIREHIKVIIGTQHENKNLAQKTEQAEKSLKQAEEKLLQKDKVINELRLRVPISERDAITKAANKSAEKDDYEARQALKIAQATVSSQQQMLSRKEQSLAKYQEMLKEAREEAKKQADQHKLEIKLLQDRVHLESDEVFKKMKLTHQESINAPGRPMPTEEQLARLSELEETVAEQDNALAIAAEKFKRSREDNVKLRKDNQDQINAMKIQHERKSGNYETQIKELQDEILIKDNKLTEKNKELEVLRDELDAAKEANQRAPTRTMKQLVERLRNQLALKEKQQKSLSQALLQLRADMVTAAEENVQVNARKAEEEVNIQHVVDKQTSGLQNRIEELQERMDKLKRELKNKKEKENSLVEERDKLKQEIAKKDFALLKLGTEVKELQDIQNRLESKEDELSDVKRKVIHAEREADKLRKQVKSLETQLGVERAEGDIVVTETQDVTAAAPTSLDFPTEAKPSKSNVEVAKWEESKKWQRKVENLKEKLNEKNKELEKSEKTNAMLRDALQRGEKDKTGLQNRLKSAARVGSTPAIPPSSDEFVQDLKHKIFALEDQNQDLKRQLVLGHDKQLEALQLRNDQLNEAVKSLEEELSRRMTDQRTIDQSDAEMYRDIHDKNQSLQRQLLQAKEENMELRFEYEQARKENPRLKARVDDLQEYVEILKAELDSTKKREKARKKSLGTGMGGQSVEDMERVLAAMRRVVERLQGENEQLKKSVGAGGPQYHAVTKENNRLKQELERTKATMNTGKPTLSSSSERKNTAKLMHENEKLRKELKKERDESERLRVTIATSESTKTELIQVLEQAQGRLADTNLEGLSSKEWKSVVLPKVYEEKMKKLQTELDKKTSLLKDIKSYLKGAAQKEAELIKKQHELEERNTVLERFPTNIKLDSDLVRELQLSRLRVASLESEKETIIYEMQQLRQMSQAGELPRDLDQQEVVDKIRKYDEVLAGEVELNAKLKTVEIERDRLSHEVRKLQKELESFDPAFFEEIEDLKFNYQKSVERNVLYERQLRNLSKQFGIDVNIPSEDEDS